MKKIENTEKYMVNMIYFSYLKVYFFLIPKVYLQSVLLLNFKRQVSDVNKSL